MSGIQRAMNWLRSIKDAHKFDEDKIQRDDKGRFASTGGGNTGGDVQDKVKALESAYKEVKETDVAIKERKERVQEFIRRNPEPQREKIRAHREWKDRRAQVIESLQRMEQRNRNAKQEIKELETDRQKNKW